MQPSSVSRSAADTQWSLGFEMAKLPHGLGDSGYDPAPTYAATGRIGAPSPARVRRMRPKTMIRLVTLNAAPTRNAGV